MKITSSMISTIVFIITFIGYITVQFLPHVNGTVMTSLYSIMALTLGHALGSSGSQGTTAIVHLPENVTTQTTAKTPVAGNTNGVIM